MSSAVKRCIENAVDQILNARELDEDMRQQIANSLKRYIDRDQMPNDQALQKLQFLMRDARRDIYVAHVSKQARDLKTQELAERFGNLPAQERGTAVRNWLEADSMVRQREGASVHARTIALQREKIGALHELWDNLFNVFGGDKPFAQTFHRELLGVDTGNATAKNLARKYREEVNPLLDRIRKAGVYVGQIDNYSIRSHSVSKIQSRQDEWADFLRRNLDPDEHPDPDATAHRVLDHLLHRDQTDPQGAVISMQRELTFREPDAEFEYFMRFGEDGYAHQLMHNTMMLAKRTVLVEEMGPSPNHTGNQLVEQAARDARTMRAEAQRTGDRSTERAAGQSERQARYAQQILDAQTGDLATPDSQTLANWASAGRNWMATQFLGKVGLLAATQDSLISMFRSRFHGPGFGVGTARNIRSLTQIMGSRAAREYATELGLWTNAFHATAAGRFSTPFAQGENLRMMSTKASTATQRLSGSIVAEQALRSAFGLTVSRNLAKNLQNGWRDLHPRYQKLLANSGFTEGTWNQFRREAVTNEMGAIDFRGMRGSTRELAMSFLHREADSAVIHPGDFDRVVLTAGQRAGTLSGEAVATATQFWSWPIAFFRNAVMFEAQMGKTGFVGFSAGMMMAGAMATQLYAHTAGEPMFEWDSPELWMRTATRSGLLTPAGDLVVQAARGFEPQFGPLGAQGVNLVQSLSRSAQRGIDSEAERAAAPIAQFARDMLVPNYFWSDYAVTNRVMDYVMWELDPQYMRNRERRWRNEGRQL